MKVSDTDLVGVRMIEPRIFGDERGRFHENWNDARYREHGIDVGAVQSNVSVSQRGVLRGMHYQWPEHPQGKLVSVLEGEVYDVAVDIRRGSPQFGRWTAAYLSGDNHRQLWIPPGFAHGFVVVSERAIFQYLCSAPYHPASDRGIRWNDAQLAIDWPVSAPSLSDKDAGAPFLVDVDESLLPEYTP